MPNIVEVEAQIVALLPPTGEVPFEDFKATMNAAGLGQYANRLTSMRKRGLVTLAVRTQAGGGVLMTVSRVGG